MLKIACAMALFASLAARASAEAIEIPISADRTAVTWTLGAPLHTVHGNLRVKDGTLRFDPQSSAIEGSVTIDLTTGGSGDAKRDGKMREEVLQTPKYPLAIFTAHSLLGRLAPSGNSHVTLGGTLQIHGAAHELALPLYIEARDGRVVSGETQFTIPYVAWGMHDPSTFFLRVSDHVDVDVRVTASASPTR
jgi:polyisoprenoid-binding protein YceI